MTYLVFTTSAVLCLYGALNVLIAVIEKDGETPTLMYRGAVALAFSALLVK